MNRYYERARALATVNNEPTMTDQSQANDTDINVIVKRYGIHGQAPGTNEAQLYEDLTNFPTDLRDILDTARNLDSELGKLPPELQGIPFGTLMNMTNDELTAILTPTPAKPPAPKDEQQ